MDNEELRLKVADFMEQNKILTKLDGMDWFYVENELVEFIRDIIDND